MRQLIFSLLAITLLTGCTPSHANPMTGEIESTAITEFTYCVDGTKIWVATYYQVSVTSQVVGSCE